MTSLTSSTNLNNTSDNTTANGAPKKVIAYKGTTTTGDATKDAAKYFEKGMNELAAKHGTTIERPTEENNSSEANGQSLKMISQETFDSVVQENVEDFGRGEGVTRLMGVLEDILHSTAGASMNDLIDCY